MPRRQYTCAFRAVTGPLASGLFWYPPAVRWDEYHGMFGDRVRARQLIAEHLQHIFVERATCDMVSHRYHCVGHLDTPTLGREGWIYGLMGREQLGTLVGAHYALAPGYTCEDDRFVLVPRFPTQQYPHGRS